MTFGRADAVMVQCWIFGLEMGAGASFAGLLKVLEDFPASYRPRAQA
jgi:hypothetical protein